MRFAVFLCLTVFSLAAGTNGWCGEPDTAEPQPSAPPKPVRKPRLPSELDRRMMDLPPPKDLPKLSDEPRDVLVKKLREAIEKKDAARKAELEYQLGRLIAAKYAGEDYERGISYFKSAAEGFEKLGQSARNADCLMQLGLLFEAQGESAEAAGAFEKADDVFAKMDDPVGRAAAEFEAGKCHFALGRYDEAARSYARSLKFTEELDNPAATAVVLNNIGVMHFRRGAYDQARELFMRSLTLFEALKDRAGTANLLNSIAALDGMRGSYDLALMSLTRSLKLTEELNNRGGAITALRNIGIVHGNRGDYDQALEYFSRSLKLAEELGDRVRTAESLGNAGFMKLKLGADAQALECYNRALKIYQELDARAEVAMTFNDIAMFLLTTREQSLRDPKRALDLAKQAMAEANEANPHILDTLAEAYHANGMFKEAVETEEKAEALAPGKFKDALARFRKALETGKPVERPPEAVREPRAENSKPDVAPKTVRKPRPRSDFDRQTMELPAPKDLPKLTDEPRDVLIKKLREAIENKEIARKVELEYQLGRLIAEKFAGEDYERGLSYLKSAAEGFESLGQPARKAECLWRLGLLFKAQGEIAEAVGVFEKSEEAYAKLNDPLSHAAASLQAEECHFILGHYDDALKFLEASLKLTEEAGNPAATAAVLNNMGVFYVRRGANDRAREYFSHSLKIFEELGDRPATAILLASIGAVDGQLGAFDQALESLTRGLKLSEELGSRGDIATALCNIGLVHCDHGAYDQALEYFTRSLKLSEELGDRHNTAVALGNIGLVHLKRGADTQAIEYYTRSHKIAEELGDRFAAAEALGKIGVVCLARGTDAQALEFFNRSLKIYEELDARAEVATQLNNLAMLRVTAHDPALRDPRRALDLAKLAVAATNEANPQMLDTLAETYHANGMFKEAVEAEEKAEALAPGKFKDALARFRKALETGKPVERPSDPVPLTSTGKIKPDDAPKGPDPASRNDENPFARYNRDQDEKRQQEEKAKSGQ